MLGTLRERESEPAPPQRERRTRVGTTADASRAIASSLRLFTQATSLGGTESLIEHRASSEGKASKTPRDLVRLSIGLEHPDDLIADLRDALG